MFQQELVSNRGSAVGVLEDVRWDPGFLRPFFETGPNHPMRGKRCVIVNVGRKFDAKLNREVAVQRQFLIDDLERKNIYSPVFNATSLRREEWLAYDTAAIEASRYRLIAWSDLMGVSTYSLNGMAKMILEHETATDGGEALQDMYGLGSGRNDMPLYQLEGLPLPITYAGWEIPQRKLAISRNTPGSALDVKLAADNGRRIAELKEKQTIGVANGLAYGGLSTQTGGYGRTSQIYGMVNYPDRITKTTLNIPTSASWTPEHTVNDVLACLDLLKARKQFGEFMVYHSNDWDKYLDGDYYVTKTSGSVAPTKTLRSRLREIEGVRDVKRLDFLFAAPPTANRAASDYYGPGGEGINGNYPFTLVFLKMDSLTCRAVSGMGLTTVQWESQGGGRLNFRLMEIEVPQFFSDYYGNCGILHANASASPI